MKIQYFKQIVTFMVLMTSVSQVSAETEKGDIIYTDKGVPIKFGSVIVSEAIPTLTKIPVRDAPTVRAWIPGDPIKEIPRIHWNQEKAERLSKKTSNQNETQIDPLLNKQANSHSIRSLDPGTVNRNGQGFSGANPPDTVGDVGINYYLQGINGAGGTTVVIYNKDGSIEAGPFTMASLGSGNCATGYGDPIILFDDVASRWMISEFSDSGNQLCVYISQTGDPTGSYYAYAFTASNSFPDYPKYGVWSNAYYMGSNESSSTLYAFDRDNMLLGNAATLQSFNAPSLSGFGFQMITPADLDGSTPPAANAPGLFLRHRDTESHGAGTCPNAGTGDCIEIFEFDVDWTTPANSSLTGPTMIEVTDFDSNLCGLTSFNCFPQSGSGTTLDPLREVMMWRVAYRNFGTHESIVGNLVTDVDGTDHGGVRWIELRNTGAGWTLHDEGTFAPDAESRWMGSAAMDESGNIAIAYNRSSSSTFPSLAFTGRLSTDPAGTMGTEQTIIAGSSANGSNRWGDYAALSIDPVDGCTFWFTGQYSPSSNWSTRIANFSFSECGVSGFTMNGTNLTQSVCVNPNANLSTISLDLAPLNGFSESVSFAFDPALPTGFTSSGGFTPGSLTPPGSSNVDISVNNTAANGANNFQITGTSATANKSLDVSIFVTNGVPAQTTLISPADTSTAASSPTFIWSAVADTADYTLEIATDVGFNNIIYSTTQSGTSLELPVALAANTTHYWRVTANNGCGSGVVSTTFSFDTPTLVCFSTLTAIPDNDSGGVTTTINFGGSGNVSNLLVTADISHTWVGDLIFSLEHENTGTTVILMDRPDYTGSGFGCASNDVNTVFDDTSINIVEDQCNGTPPAIGPDSLPQQALSNFDGIDSAGNWNLTVSDNQGQDTGSINEWCLDITLAGSNEPAVANNDSPAAINEDSGANTVDVLNNDSDTELDPFVVIAKTDGTHGDVAITNAGADVSYTPDDDYCGADSFTYFITGGDSATVTMDITCLDDAPIAVDDGATVAESSSNNAIDVLTNDTDIDNGPKNVTSVGTAGNGTTAFTAGGVTYTPTQNYCGADSFTYTITGGDSANVTIDVTCSDDAPMAVDDGATVLEDSINNAINVLVNDTDTDGGPKDVIGVGTASNGTTAFTSGGVTYTPTANYCGADSFTYSITGGDSATVTMDVTCVNDEPNFAKDAIVYVKLSDIGSPLAEIVACQFDMGPDNEDSTQSVNDFMVNIDSDPNGILSSVDVLNDGSLSATYSGNQGVATLSLTLQDDGGTTNSGDDSVTQSFSIEVQDTIFRGSFEIETCPQLDI